MIATPEPIPLVLLTGFLGSGKTTLLNALLRDPDMTGTAVLVNEIGAVGIDHNLVVGANDDILLLEGGCLCCQPRGSVSEGVARLLALEPKPRRIVVETSGAANPLPILETLSDQQFVAGGLQFPRVVTVVDCVFGQATLQQHSEARFQVVAADIVVLGKTDLAPANAKAVLEDLVARENPTARRLEVAGDALPDGFVEALHEPVDRMTAQAALPATHNEKTHGETEFVTAGISFDGRLTVETVQRWLDRILESYGGNILRIKGVLKVEEFERPAVLQCVRDIVHPFQLLDEQSSDMTRNSVVAIGWDMHPGLLDEALGWLAQEATHCPT